MQIFSFGNIGNIGRYFRYFRYIATDTWTETDCDISEISARYIGKYRAVISTETDCLSRNVILTDISVIFLHFRYFWNIGRYIASFGNIG